MVPREISWRNVRHHWEIYLFIVPTLVLIGLFLYYPAASGIVHSFYRWNGADISEYVGWRNYLLLVQSAEFWDSFKVAFILGAWNIFKMIPAVLVAVCIHRCRSERLQFFYRAMFVVPMVIPGLVVALIWRSFFFEATSGFLNRVLGATGLFDVLMHLDKVLGWGGIFTAGKSAAWLGDPKLILTACIIWGFPWVGSFAVLTHLAKLQGIEKQIYEAAEIDGSGWWSKFFRIELPLITGSIYIMLVFVIIDTIKDAGIIIALAGFEGGPGGVVTVPALFMLRKAFLDQQMGYACAVGILLTLVIMGLQKLSTAVINWQELRRWQKVFCCATAWAAAGLLLYYERLIPLAVILVLLTLPWRAWLATGGRVLVASYPIRTTLDALSYWRERRRTSHLHKGIRLPTLGDTMGNILVRLAKHLTIWTVLLFAFLPIYLMAIVSLKSNQQFYEAPASLSEPYHWENWDSAWEAVRQAVKNSIFISATATALTLSFALCSAYFFGRVKMPMAGLFWNAVLILMMMPTIANLVPLYMLLRNLGLVNALTGLILVGAASGQMFGIFVLRNFVADIPQDLFEAAEIDGASHFQQMRTIVLPLSGPILGTVGVMIFVGQWNEFVLPLILMRDQGRLPVMVQLLRMAGEYIKYWGPLMAGYTFASIPIVILFIFTMRLFVRGMTEGAVKN